MNRASTQVFDAFIADGSTPTYTSLDHVVGLASGRQISLMVRATKYDTNSLLTVDIEQSVDGKNFQSKYMTYVGEPVKNPIIGSQMLAWNMAHPARFSDVFTAAEANPPRPNLRFSRLAITVLNGDTGLGSYAYLKITACVRGSSDVVEAAPAQARARSAPGSLGRHGEMVEELGALVKTARGLDPAARIAYIGQNMRPDTKEHFRAVEQKLQALHPATRQKMLETTTSLMRHVMASTGPVRASSGQDAACCDGAPKAKPCNECTSK